MTKMRRRGLMVAMLGSTALAACSGTTSSTTAWATDASALFTGLNTLLPQIANITGLPAAAATAAQTALTAAAGLAKQLAATATSVVGAPLLAQIEGYVNTAFQALQPYFSILPAPFGTALTAISLLLPFVETAFGMVVANINVGGRRPMLVRVAPPSASPIGMSPSQVHDWAVSVLVAK